MDPVCGKTVDYDRFRLVFKHSTYYFCSALCQAEFKRSPESYFRKGEQK